MAPIAPLLTIAIPTYNRSGLLKVSLDYIYAQVKDKEFSIELIVSDNCSSDNTPGIVNDFVKKGLSIRYIKNNENKGPDFNIAQCYVEAKGKYVMALGDDDILIEGSIEQILKILSKDEYGIVYLNQISMKEYMAAPAKCGEDSLDLQLFEDSTEFFKKVSYYVTFISANIINKKYLDEINIEDGLGSYLVQVPLICRAIFGATQNLYIKTKLLVAADVENSGGYSVFKVFGENLLNILHKNLDGTKNEYLIDYIKNDLICRLFPFWIITLKNSIGNYESSSPKDILKVHFGNKIKYWIVIYPMSKLTPRLSKLYYSLVIRLGIV